MIESDERQELARLIREEKQLVARDLLASAWDEGIEAGIEPEILADAIVCAAIEELVAHSGQSWSAKLVEKLVTMENEGRFTTIRTLQ
ncbi:MAG: hypothetical protein R3D34_11370 [Nitratireductor sp.]|nr:hypothetical protein [Nitratireductor sp.]